MPNNSEDIYHILNGDALREQFPQDIYGHRIIFREVLMDGPLSASLGEALFVKREKFLSQYDAPEEDFYRRHVVPELMRLQQMAKGSKVYLWFEYDLFCQVNMWAAVTWIRTKLTDVSFYWAAPKPNDWRGFGALSSDDLSEVYTNARLLTDTELVLMEKAFLVYISQDRDLLTQSLAQEHWTDYLHTALLAQRQRMPDEQGNCELYARVDALIAKHKTFPDFFKAFCQEEGQFGLGDLQAKQLYEARLRLM